MYEIIVIVYSHFSNLNRYDISEITLTQIWLESEDYESANANS